jgi:uncharacterized protein
MWVRFILFLVVFFSLVGLSQWWAYRQFTDLFGYKKFFFWTVVCVVAVSVAYITVGQLRLDAPDWVIEFVFKPVNVWVAVSLVLAVLTPLWWGISKLGTLGTTDDEAKQTARRDFLRKTAKGALAGAYALALGDAMFSAQRDRIKRYTVALPNLPDELVGLKIAQLSDIHVGVYWGIERFQRIAEKLKTTDHDYLVITGDLIDNSPSYAPVLAEGLKFLHAKKECIAILGNHDHYAVADVVADAVKQTHVKLLRNETFNAEHNGGTISFLGVEDPMGALDENDDTNESGLKQALTQKTGFPIVLMHRPTQWDAVKKHNLPFALCGHTHAGQIAIPFTQINAGNFVYKHSVGFYYEPTLDGLLSTLFVHPGNGVAGIPIRLGCPPEIAVFEFKKA